MNINLSAAAARQKSAAGSNPNSNVKFGLNRRGGVFDDDSSQDEAAAADTGKDEVNRDIAAEQAALRKRAQAAMSSVDAGVYDYDGAYDSIHAQRQEEAKKQHDAQQKNKGSRYVTDLLRAAKKREIERDGIYERKLAKEQAEEEANEDYRGKEKFITKAYKRKLAEREEWAKEEEAKRLKEEQEDVSKKKDGEAFASFYGNLNRNVAMGGGSANTDNKKEIADIGPEITAHGETDGIARGQSEKRGGMAFLEGFERADVSDAGEEQGKGDATEDPELKLLSARKAREEKVAQARIRYFQRHGITDTNSGERQ